MHHWNAYDENIIWRYFSLSALDILVCWEFVLFIYCHRTFFFHFTDSTDDEQSNLDIRIHFKCRESESLLQANK